MPHVAKTTVLESIISIQYLGRDDFIVRMVHMEGDSHFFAPSVSTTADFPLSSRNLEHRLIVSWWTASVCRLINLVQLLFPLFIERFLFLNKDESTPVLDSEVNEVARKITTFRSSCSEEPVRGEAFRAFFLRKRGCQIFVKLSWKSTPVPLLVPVFSYQHYWIYFKGRISSFVLALCSI